tara:strand:- start:945 stop:1289 length:345 start_codon:yes stop_codon:yes gene_type:complete
MNQLIKAETKKNKIKTTMKKIFYFIFSNSIGISGITALICFAFTDLLILLKISAILSIAVISLICILSIQALYSFGLDKCYVEIEAKFLELTLYSSLILGTLLFLIIEISRTSQ